MAIRNALIAVDFDGTVVTHAYPEIGDDAGAVPVLKELTDNGCRLILYTMRHGKLLGLLGSHLGSRLHGAEREREQRRVVVGHAVRVSDADQRVPQVRHRRQEPQARLVCRPGSVVEAGELSDR